jgi:hypothetical protein
MGFSSSSSTMNMTEVMMTEAKIAFGMYAREGIRNPKANKTKTAVNGITLLIALNFRHVRSGMFTDRHIYWLAVSWPRLRLALNSFQMKR